MSTPDQPDEPPKRTVSKKTANIGCLGLVGAFALIVGLILFGGSGGSDTDAGSEVDETTAEVMCQQFVKERLKAPSTAEFPSGEDGAAVTVMSEDPLEYRVQSHVDAENSFGAAIRNDYTCTIRHEGGRQFTLMDMQGLEN